jgi:hypothetical protein
MPLSLVTTGTAALIGSPYSPPNPGPRRNIKASTTVAATPHSECRATSTRLIVVGAQQLPQSAEVDTGDVELVSTGGDQVLRAQLGHLDMA